MRRILRIVFFPFIWVNDHDSEILLFLVKFMVAWFLFLAAIVVCVALWTLIVGPIKP